MINIVFDVTVLFLALKLVWNVLAPVIAVYRHISWRKSGGVKPGAISMVSILDVMLWIMLVLMAGYDSMGHFAFSRAEVAFYGAGAILLSYFVSAIIGYWLRRRIRL